MVITFNFARSFVVELHVITMDPTCNVRFTFDDESGEGVGFSIVARNMSIRLMKMCDYLAAIMSPDSPWSKGNGAVLHVTLPLSTVATILVPVLGEMYSFEHAASDLSAIFDEDFYQAAPLCMRRWVLLFALHAYLGAGKLFLYHMRRQLLHDVRAIVDMFHAWFTRCLCNGIEEMNDACSHMLTEASVYVDNLYRANRMNAISLAEGVADICTELSIAFTAPSDDMAAYGHVRKLVIKLLSAHRNMHARGIFKDDAEMKESSRALFTRIKEFTADDGRCVFQAGESTEFSTEIAYMLRSFSYNGRGEPYDLFVAGGAALASAMRQAGGYSENMATSDIDIFVCGERGRCVQVMMALIQHACNTSPIYDIVIGHNVTTLTPRRDPDQVDGRMIIQFIISTRSSMVDALMHFDKTAFQWAYDGFGYWCSPEFLVCLPERVSYKTNHCLDKDVEIARIVKSNAKGFRVLPDCPYWKRPMFCDIPYAHMDCFEFVERLMDSDAPRFNTAHPLMMWGDGDGFKLKYTHPVGETQDTKIYSVYSTKRVDLDGSCRNAPLAPKFELIGPVEVMSITYNSGAIMKLRPLYNFDVVAAKCGRDHVVASEGHIFTSLQLEFVDGEMVGLGFGNEQPEREMSTWREGIQYPSHIRVGDIISCTISSPNIQAIEKHVGEDLAHIRAVFTNTENTSKRKHEESDEGITKRKREDDGEDINNRKREDGGEGSSKRTKIDELD